MPKAKYNEIYLDLKRAVEDGTYPYGDLMPSENTLITQIEILRFCGHSYAMDNAPEDVKSAANCVCPSNEEDGVLVTLEKIFL